MSDEKPAIRWLHLPVSGVWILEGSDKKSIGKWATIREGDSTKLLWSYYQGTYDLDTLRLVLAKGEELIRLLTPEVKSTSTTEVPKELEQIGTK